MARSLLLKRLVRLHHFCAQLLIVPISEALSFLLSLQLWPLAPCPHLSSHNGLLAVGLEFTSVDSHMSPSLPPCLCSITVLLRKPSLILEFKKIEPPHHSLSSLLCFIPYIALIIICFTMCLFIVSFLPLEYELRGGRGFVCHCYHLEQALISSLHLSNEGKGSSTQPRYSPYEGKKKTFVDMWGPRHQVTSKHQFLRETLELSRMLFKKE